MKLTAVNTEAQKMAVWAHTYKPNTKRVKQEDSKFETCMGYKIIG